MIDTGAGSTVVSGASLAQHNIAPDQIGPSGKNIGIGGLTGAENLEQFSELDIGGEAYTPGILAAAPKGNFLGTDGLLGETYLRSHQVYIDYDTATAWLGLTVGQSQ